MPEKSIESEINLEPLHLFYAADFLCCAFRWSNQLQIANIIMRPVNGNAHGTLLEPQLPSASGLALL